MVFTTVELEADSVPRCAASTRRPRRPADRRQASGRHCAMASKSITDAEIVHIARDIVVPVRGGAFSAALVRHALDCLQAFFASRSLAWFSIHLVALVSAGPPVGGLYLKPPSSGGLCEGVITMPSARPSLRPRLYVEDGVRERGRRRISAFAVDHHVDPVGRQHFQSA